MGFLVPLFVEIYQAGFAVTMQRAPTIIAGVAPCHRVRREGIIPIVGAWAARCSILERKARHAGRLGAIVKSW